MFCNHVLVDESSMRSDPKSYPSILSLSSYLLRKKYLTSKEYYYRNVVQQIIYNEATHIVVMFKDYLILDDMTEFLKNFYEYERARSKLPRILHFYSKYSKVFPNYILLPESKFMFKNIEDIQDFYDSRNRYLLKVKEEQKRNVQNKQLLIDMLKKRARGDDL